jgi:hypothetical protein
VLDPIPVDAVVAALDDELQLGAHLAGQIPPLRTGGFRSAYGVDDDVVPKSELLSGEGTDDQVRSGCDLAAGRRQAPRQNEGGVMMDKARSSRRPMLRSRCGIVP